MEYIQEIEGQVGQLKNVSKEIRKKIRLGKLDEAYRLTAQYPNDLIIMSQRCTILIKQGRLEEAKIIGKQFEDDPIIQRVIILYVKANFGLDNNDSEKYYKSYLLLKQSLSLCGDYNVAT